MKIKIVSTPETNSITRRPWHAKHIGEIFKVSARLPRSEYVVIDGNRRWVVPKENCIVIKNHIVAKIILTLSGIAIAMVAAHIMTIIMVWLVNGYMNPSTPIDYRTCYFVAIMILIVVAIYIWAQLKDLNQYLKNINKS